MSRPIIMLASHHDGIGAHVTMCHVCRGLLKAAKGLKKDILIVYLNNSALSKRMRWAQDMWQKANNGKALLPSVGGGWPAPKGVRGKTSVWIPTNNALWFEKTPEGGLDAAKTARNLTGYALKTAIQTWAGPLQVLPDPPEQHVKLAIEMGIPQLSAWARGLGIRAVCVGGMFWSRALRESLRGAGEYGRDIRDALSRIAEYEKSADEVWLLPIVAPRAYVDFLAQESIPVLTLPGFFGSSTTTLKTAQVYVDFLD